MYYELTKIIFSVRIAVTKAVHTKEKIAHCDANIAPPAIACDLQIFDSLPRGSDINQNEPRCIRSM